MHSDRASLEQLAGMDDQALLNQSKSPIRWCRTFIDIDDSKPQTSLRRSNSEPDLGSDCSSQSSHFFGSDRAYVENLSDKMSSIWTPQGCHIKTSGHNRIKSTGSECNSSAGMASEGWDRDSILAESEVAAAAEAGRVAWTTPDPWPPTRISRRELRVQIHAQTQQVSDRLVSQKRRQALTALEELPEQVEEVLQQSGATFFAQAQDKVAVMREMILENQFSDEHISLMKAMENLPMIPDVMLHSFAASVVRAKECVQQRIEEIIHGFENGHLASSAELFAEMRALPTLASTAFQEAAEVARAQVQEAQALQEELSALRAEWLMTKRLSCAAGETKVSIAIVQQVEQVVAAVKDQQQIEGAVANQVVADLLLRAKAVNQQPQDGAIQAFHLSTNPGSVGHPEVCSRPCLYYAAGNCANGNACDFCHLLHDKRPAHLDKRNRDILQELPFDAVVALVLPVVREKVQALTESPEVLHLVDALEGMFPTSQSSFDSARNRPLDLTAGSEASTSDKLQCGSCRPSQKKSQRSERRLVAALKSMSLRLLLSALHRSVLPESPETKNTIDTLLRHLRKANVACSDSFATLYRGSAHSVHD